MQGKEKWGVTRVKLTRFRYSWTIQNFSFLRKKIGEELESPSFSIGTDSNAKWCLKLYLQGINENFKDFLSLYLYKKSGVAYQSDGQYTLSVLTKEGMKFMENTEEYQSNKIYSSWGFPAFIKSELIRDKSLNLLADDALRLQCEVIIMMGIDTFSSKDTDVVKSRDEIAENALNHFEKLFLDERLSDVKLNAACGRALNAHKSVLAARSPVFAAMFEHDTVEKKMNVVDIDDIEYDVLKEMLRFIYSARVVNIEKLTSELLVAADKYQIEGLKEICVRILSENMSFDNVAEVLVVADRHHLASLKEQAMNFMKAHIKDVIKTPGFESIEQVNLLAEIIKSLGQ